MTITEPIVIDLPFCDKPTRNAMQVICVNITLCEKHFVLKSIVDYNLDENESGVWKKVKSNYTKVGLRKDISEVELFYNSDLQLWFVTMDCHGIATGHEWGYKKQSDAKQFYNTLVDYFINQ